MRYYDHINSFKMNNRSNNLKCFLLKIQGIARLTFWGNNGEFYFPLKCAIVVEGRRFREFNFLQTLDKDMHFEDTVICTQHYYASNFYMSNNNSYL